MAVKSGRLSVSWSKKESDILISWGAGGARKEDAWLMHGIIGEYNHALGKSLREELEDRGYDIETLVFRIDRKK